MCKLRKSIGSFIITVIAMTCLSFAFAPTRSNAAVELINKKIGPNVTAILTSDGTLDIFGTGPISPKPDNVYSIWGVHRDKIKNIEIEEGITSIGEDVFSGCSDLRVISLPNTLTLIDNGAFILCENLEEVRFGNNLKTINNNAFIGCTKLQSISLPESLEMIKQGAFVQCGLTSVTIPEKVKVVEPSAFFRCPLGSFIVKNKNTMIGYMAAGFSYNKESGENYAIDDMTIFGPINSDAERYAEENGFDFICTDTIPIPKISSVVMEENGVRVTWARVNEAKGYYLLRKTGSGAFYTIQTIEDNSKSTFSCLDSSVSSGKNYTYAVVAYRGINNSGYSGKSILYLSRPSVNTANEVSGLRVKWSKTTGAKGYYVMRKSGSGSYSKIATITKATTTSYLDKKATSGKKYTYAVKAYNGSWQSAYNEKEQIRLSAPSIKLTRSTKQMKITWKKITGAKGYYVYRKAKGGSYTRIATIKNGSTVSYTDKTIKKGVKYTYYVVAYNGSTLSSYTAKTK